MERLPYPLLEKPFKAANWIESEQLNPVLSKPFHFAEEGLTEEMIAILRQGDIILDCQVVKRQESPNLLKIMSCITPT
jgi:hypothetical protein